MINTKRDYKNWTNYEKEQYKKIGYKGKLHAFILSSEVDYIYEYVRLLRIDEYLTNIRSKNIIRKMFVRRKRNRLGLRLGMFIPINVFEKGLLIYHSNGIVVNKLAKVGENCKIHGDVCIGNNGITEEAPVLGNNIDIGIGAKIIGNVKIADNNIIAANAVVTKSFEETNGKLVGVPARRI